MAKCCTQSIGVIMEMIIVDKPITFNAGAKLKLSDAQVVARPLRLAPVQGQEGVYHVLDKVVFKCGEEIGVEDSRNMKRSEQEKIKPKNQPRTKKRLVKQQAELEVEFAPEEDPVDSDNKE